MTTETAALEAARRELERAEDAAARAEVDACRSRFEAAATRLGEVRERRRQLEREIGEREALRVHDARCR